MFQWSWSGPQSLGIKRVKGEGLSWAQDSPEGPEGASATDPCWLRIQNTTEWPPLWCRESGKSRRLWLHREGPGDSSVHAVQTLRGVGTALLGREHACYQLATHWPKLLNPTGTSRSPNRCYKLQLTNCHGFCLFLAFMVTHFQSSC
jgi:hypothetical protein